MVGIQVNLCFYVYEFLFFPNYVFEELDFEFKYENWVDILKTWKYSFVTLLLEQPKKESVVN